MLAGIVPLSVGGFLSPHPVSRNTLLSLAREKNTRLRADLGLPVELHFEPVIGAETSGRAALGSLLKRCFARRRFRAGSRVVTTAGILQRV